MLCVIQEVSGAIIFSTLLLTFGMAISPTGGVFSYLPHHLDLASEDSVGHNLVPAPSETCWFRGMSVGGSFRRV